MGRVVLRNIGLLLSGDLHRPILDADTILVVDGKIAAVGGEKDIDCEGADVVVDARGDAAGSEAAGFRALIRQQALERPQLVRIAVKPEVVAPGAGRA